jgi:hypothetical protein
MDPNGNESGKSYVIFGKTDTVAIDLAKLGGDSKYAINYLGGFVTRIGTTRTHNQIIQAIAVDIACAGD